jgi:hypothetical protein
MRAQLAIGGLMIASTVALVWARSARAEEYLEPPPAGLEVSFQNKYVVCHTKEQVVEIGKLGATEYAPMLAKINEQFQKATDHGEHTCFVTAVEDIFTGESEETGFLIDANGVKSKAWVLHIGNEHGEYWMLYAVHPKQAPKDTSI